MCVQCVYSEVFTLKQTNFSFTCGRLKRVELFHTALTTKSAALVCRRSETEFTAGPRGALPVISSQSVLSETPCPRLPRACTRFRWFTESILNVSEYMMPRPSPSLSVSTTDSSTWWLKSIRSAETYTWDGTGETALHGTRSQRHQLICQQSIKHTE